MQMANCLLERGHTVRIAYRRPLLLSRKRLLSLARSVTYRLRGLSETRWLSWFKGCKETFITLKDLQFAEREVIIGTGPGTIPELRRLNGNVLKLGYCHGLMDSEKEIWRGLDTITVSPVHVPTLEQDCQARVWGVVPNGISPEEYFVEQKFRDGVGFIFGRHFVKGPEVAISLARALHNTFPETPCYVFGADRPLTSLVRCEYTRFPSVNQARAIYNKCKIWLVTSRAEGFCLPILEAMACGCAVVSSRHTNAAELIQDGVNGFTVPYGDVKAYMKYIGQLLTDESLRRRLVQQGFKTVKRYPWSEAANRMEEALTALSAVGVVKQREASPRLETHGSY